LSVRVIGEFVSLSKGEIKEATLAKVMISRLSDVEYGLGSVWSSYFA
jgi:hypothetical protein